MPAASLCAVELVTRSSDLRWNASDSALTFARTCRHSRNGLALAGGVQGEAKGLSKVSMHVMLLCECAATTIQRPWAGLDKHDLTDIESDSHLAMMLVHCTVASAPVSAQLTALPCKQLPQEPSGSQLVRNLSQRGTSTSINPPQHALGLSDTQTLSGMRNRIGRYRKEQEMDGMRGVRVGAAHLIQGTAMTDPFGHCSLGSSRAHVLRLALQLRLPLRVGGLQLLSQVLHPCDTLSERLKARDEPERNEGRQLYGVASLLLISQMLHTRSTPAVSQDCALAKSWQASRAESLRID